MDKKSLRKEMLRNRSKIPYETRENYSKLICNSLSELEYYKNADIIMAFISFGSEINTKYIIEHSISLGKKVVIPIMIPETKELLISEIRDFSELELGFYNILTPKEEFIRILNPDTIDLILVPGLIFAKDGYRIGYGGGYYDRFLSNRSNSIKKIAIGFDMQVVDKVPIGKYDIPVDFILTEERFIETK